MQDWLTQFTSFEKKKIRSLLLNLLRSLLLLEGKGGGEYSEARLSFLRTIIEELVTKPVTTLGTRDF